MFEVLRQKCCDANRALFDTGLVLNTFGNVSCCDRASKVFAIKPSGVEYTALSPEQIVIVDFDCRVVEGELRPSSDTPTHAVLYRRYQGLGGVVHTHSPYATSWAQALRDIPIYGTTHADHLFCAVPCTELMSDERTCGQYELETGLQIVDCFMNRSFNADEVEMVLVGGHGVFAWGRDAGQALLNARVLEELAKMAFLTEQLNPKALPLKNSIIRKHFTRKHGKDACYGQRK